MGAKRKRCRKVVAVDMLSNLPDEVLGLILSFLPVDQAVRTSILSKRWVGLFSFATCLNFRDCRTSGTRFINLVDTVLKQHKVVIKRFNLKFWSYDKSGRSPADAWITDALSLGAQELDIDVRGYYRVNDTTLHNLFNSCKVAALALRFYVFGGMILKVPTSVCLPSLSILELSDINFPDGDSVSRFFLGCSSLKDLTLRDCRWIDGAVYYISSVQLRILTICVSHDKKSYTQAPNIELDLPSMVYFEYNGFPWESYHIKNSHALSTAKLSLLGGHKTVPMVSGLLRALSSVKVLHLLGHSMKTISIKRRRLPTFDNLSRLVVGTHSSKEQRGWRILSKFLIHSPALETLVFKEGFDSCYAELEDLLGYAPFSTNPMIIRVDNYRGSKKEYRMVKLILKCRALKVKQLIVNWPSWTWKYR